MENRRDKFHRGFSMIWTLEKKVIWILKRVSTNTGRGRNNVLLPQVAVSSRMMNTEFGYESNNWTRQLFPCS